ncbi:MAG: hypothetical protein HYY96_07250 [Candidatus Tectomicrobia bacterium]|nr:hypothetical protein [Candidatus Tectomicrobia bacterium]
MHRSTSAVMGFPALSSAMLLHPGREPAAAWRRLPRRFCALLFLLAAAAGLPLWVDAPAAIAAAPAAGAEQDDAPRSGALLDRTLLRAHLAFRSGALDRATLIYRALSTRDPAARAAPAPQALREAAGYQLGRLAQAQRQYQRAEGRWLSFLQRHPHSRRLAHAAAHRELASALRHVTAGELQQALQRLRALLHRGEPRPPREVISRIRQDASVIALLQQRQIALDQRDLDLYLQVVDPAYAGPGGMKGLRARLGLLFKRFQHIRMRYRSVHLEVRSDTAHVEADAELRLDGAANPTEALHFTTHDSLDLRHGPNGWRITAGLSGW